MENIQAAFRSPRPCVTRINADTSWVISLPCPNDTQNGRSRFNILIDPWLQGSQTEWFGTQWHQVKSSVQKIKDLDRILCEAERNNSAIPGSFIDLVVISHEMTDHCHKTTLLEIIRSVPVFASPRAAALIRSWNHFDIVVDIPTGSIGLDWRTSSFSPLPHWIGISRLSNNSPIYPPIFGAVLVLFEDFESSSEAAEAIVYSPHGLDAAKISILSSAQPAIRPLALLHGLHQVTLAGFDANFGAPNAIDILREIGARYWFDTHGEAKAVTGIIAWFLGRKNYSMAQITEYAASVHVGDDREKSQPDDILCVPLENGETFTLQ